jgi:hypothetical protein
MLIEAAPNGPYRRVSKNRQPERKSHAPDNVCLNAAQRRGKAGRHNRFETPRSFPTVSASLRLLPFTHPRARVIVEAFPQLDSG